MLSTPTSVAMVRSWLGGALTTPGSLPPRRSVVLPATAPVPGRARCQTECMMRERDRPMGAKYFGAAVPRREDPRLLRCEGRYVDDVKLPGALHAAFLR